ncbi:hypothetical protein QZH41_015401, partial [Actinostola sp. cb2023]
KMKPITEKIRRERINNSLDELKVLILSAMNEDVSHYAKMEKADILEMAVKYIKRLQTAKPKTQGTIQRSTERECPQDTEAELTVLITSNTATRSDERKALDIPAEQPSSQVRATTSGSLDLVLPALPGISFTSVSMETSNRTTNTRDDVFASPCGSFVQSDVNMVSGTSCSQDDREASSLQFASKIINDGKPFALRTQNTMNTACYKDNMPSNQTTNYIPKVRLPGMECFIRNNLRTDVLSREADKENAFSFDDRLSHQYYRGLQMAFDDPQYLALWRPW